MLNYTEMAHHILSSLKWEGRLQCKPFELVNEVISGLGKDPACPNHSFLQQFYSSDWTTSSNITEFMHNILKVLSSNLESWLLGYHYTSVKSSKLWPSSPAALKASLSDDLSPTSNALAVPQHSQRATNC